MVEVRSVDSWWIDFSGVDSGVLAELYDATFFRMVLFAKKAEANGWCSAFVSLKQYPLWTLHLVRWLCSRYRPSAYAESAYTEIILDRLRTRSERWR